MDTTARAFITSGPTPTLAPVKRITSGRDAKGLKSDIAAALKKKKLKVAEFGRAKVARPAEVIRLEVKGLG